MVLFFERMECQFFDQVLERTCFGKKIERYELGNCVSLIFPLNSVRTTSFMTRNTCTTVRHVIHRFLLPC